MSELKKELPFEPTYSWVALSLPESITESKIELDASTISQMLTDHIRVGNMLTVSAVGPDVKIVKPGDKVAINSRGSFEIAVPGYEAKRLILDREIIGIYR